MKNLYILGLLLISSLSYSQIFTEDFENGGNIPSGWTQEFVNNNIDWIFQDGGHVDAGVGHPANAHGGSYNALFTISTHTNDGAKTKLISPSFSLTSGNDYYLTFYYANEHWNSDQDTLKVYYKASGQWHLIQTYDVSQPNWRKKILPIPNTATNIAFEGESEYGYGVCIDDVRLDQINRLPDVITCDASFTDDGGSSSNYSDNQNYIVTYKSDNNSCIRAVVDYYEIENDFDYLYIYDGNDLTGSLLQVFTGSSTDANTSSTLDDNGTAFYGLTGSLTFYFYSDNLTNDLGWIFNIDCPGNCVAPACSENINAADDCGAPTPICNLNGYCGNTGSAYTADHTELNIDNGGPFCGTIDNNSWLTFVADSSTAFIDVWVYNCQGIAPLGRVHGIQIEIFSGDCSSFSSVSNCWSPNKEANGRIKATNLTPGNTYYIMIDGWGADDCEYSFAASASSGIIVASAGPDQTICEGQVVTLDASGGNTYSWTATPSDNSLAGQESQTSINISPSQTTIYTATVDGLNTNCPSSLVDVVVYVNEANASFTGLSSEYCEDDNSSLLTGNYSSGIFSGTGISGNYFSPSTAGNGNFNINYSYDYSVITAFEDNFDPSPSSGWTHGAISGTDSWSYDIPKGGNGQNTNSNSNTDPLIDHTPSNTENIVFGQGLSENTGDGLGGYNDNSNEWLMSPAINCSSISNATLSYWQFANFENNWDEAYVEISTNGTTWIDLNQELYPQNDHWIFKSINISNYADGQTSVYIRWRSNSDNAQTYSGWNIDDVKITGVQNGGTCTSTSTQTTQVYNPATTNISPINGSVCANESFDLSASVGGGASSGNWSTSGSGSFSNPNGLNTSYIPSSADASAGQVIITFTTNNPTGPCGTASDNMTLNINQLPTVSFTSSDADLSICIGESISLTGSGNANTYSWDNGINDGIAFSPNSSGNYTLVGEDLNSCKDSITANITVNPLPTVFAGADQTIPYGTNTTISDASPSGYIYNWTPSDSLVNSNIQNPQTIALHIPNIFILDATNPATGCSNSDTVIIYISGGPLSVQIFANNNDSICLGQTHSITAIASGGGSSNYTYNWSSNPTATYPHSNTLQLDSVQTTTTYYLEVVEGGVNYAYDTITVTIMPLASISNITVDSLQCNGDNLGAIHISAQPDPLNYSIDGGITFLSNNGNFENMGVGNDFITAVQTPFGCISYGDTVNVLQPDILNINTNLLNDETCRNNNGIIDITANGGTAPYQYIWSNGDTQNSSDSLEAGNYSITVTDFHNCSINQNFSILNIGEGHLEIDSILDIRCFGDSTGSVSVSVRNGISAFDFYLSQNGNILDSLKGSTDSVYTAQFLVVGNYIITAYEGAGCESSIPVNISSSTEITSNINTINPICFGENSGSININSNGGHSPYSYSWSSDNGFTSTSQNINNLESGNYNLTVKDAFDCIVKFNTTLSQPNTPIINIQSSNSTQCLGDSVASININATGGTEPYSYKWTNGNEVFTGNPLLNLKSGNYHLLLTDNNNCVLKDTIVHLIEYEAITLKDTIKIIGNRANIDLWSTRDLNASYFKWDDNSENSGASSQRENLISGLYTVTVTDDNNCQKVVNFDIKIPFIIPSLITPNGDGLNDTWKIGNIEAFDDITIQIFNRWGNTIFLYQGTGLAYGDISKQFDGTFNGGDLPIGSYVYILDLHNGEEPKQGIVSITRTMNK